MKEEFKNVLLMGLGAMSLTNEKAKELKEELKAKGEKLYNDGLIKNEELKHNIENKIKESVTVVVDKDMTKDEMAEKIKGMSAEDKKELMSLLKETKETKEK